MEGGKGLDIVLIFAASLRTAAFFFFNDHLKELFLSASLGNSPPPYPIRRHGCM